jgi:hypothetical protein
VSVRLRALSWINATRKMASSPKTFIGFDELRVPGAPLKSDET